MSKISITPNPSGTGVFTISSPATSTNRTLTLPDEAGTIITTAGVPSSAMPAGSVIQVVSANYNLDTVISSSTATSFASVSITPTSSSNKILLFATIASIATNGNTNSELEARIYKNGSVFVGVEGLAVFGTGFNSGGWRGIGGSHAQYLDSPATTSAITYALYMYVAAPPNSVRINSEITSGDTLPAGTGITAMEVVA